MKSLHLWSGGLDSTACLVKRLRETNNDVTALYVEVVGHESKTWCENGAIARLKSRLEHRYRNFELVTAPIAALSPISSSQNVRRSVQPLFWLYAALGTTLGNTFTDLTVGYVKGDSAVEFLPDIKKMWLAQQRMQYGSAKPIPLLTPLRTWDKPRIIRYLKSVEAADSIKLLDSVWTCEDPKRDHLLCLSGFRACGECTPCKTAMRAGLFKLKDTDKGMYGRKA